MQKNKILHAGTGVKGVTAFPHENTAGEVMRAGAYYYRTTPYKVTAARLLVLRALEKRRLYLDYEYARTLLEQRSTHPLLLGDAPCIVQLKQLIGQVAPPDVSVLILGETGTGKELVARSIHAQSRRSDKCFMDINCGALSDDLLEHELFAHEPGAYTGAQRARQGLLEATNGAPG